MSDGLPLNHWRNRVAWRLANLVLRIATRDYRLRLEGAIHYGLGAVARDEAAELRAALDAARDAMVSALAYHHHSLSNPVKEELNAAINRAGRALAGGESQR